MNVPANVKTLPFGVFLRSWPKPDKYMITDLYAPLLGSITEYELRNKKAGPRLDKEVF